MSKGEALPDTLINISDRGNNRVIDFQKTFDGTTMKMVVTPKGAITILQPGPEGMEEVHFHVKSLIGMIKAIGMDWSQVQDGNYALQPVKYFKGGKV